jgi:hypothetical protein
MRDPPPLKCGALLVGAFVVDLPMQIGAMR